MLSLRILITLQSGRFWSHRHDWCNNAVDAIACIHVSGYIDDATADQ